MWLWVCDNDGTEIEPGAPGQRCPTCAGVLRQIDPQWYDDVDQADELADDADTPPVLGVDVGTDTDETDVTTAMPTKRPWFRAGSVVR